MVMVSADYLPDSSLNQGRMKLEQFSPVTKTEMKELVGKIPCKSFHLDPVPSSILKEMLDDILPVITEIANMSVNNGIHVVPSRLKYASLSPCLKKTTFDSENYSSFRPISNLTFVSKCVEKVVATQTCEHVQDNI